MKNYGNYPKYREDKPTVPQNETREQTVHRLFGERLARKCLHSNKAFLEECRRRVSEDRKRIYSLGIGLFGIVTMSTACARNWVNYPPSVVSDGKGGERVIAARAAEFNGSDIIGGTAIDVSNTGVHISANGGINNTIATAEGYRTVRYGVGAAATVATTQILASQAANAYAANQAAAATSSRAAAAASAATKLPPAAGSTINAIVPAKVTPIP